MIKDDAVAERYGGEVFDLEFLLLLSLDPVADRLAHHLTALLPQLLRLRIDRA